MHVLFDFEVLTIVAQALLEPGLDSSVLLVAPQYKMLATVFARNLYFDTHEKGTPFPTSSNDNRRLILESGCPIFT